MLSNRTLFKKALWIFGSVRLLCSMIGIIGASAIPHEKISAAESYSKPVYDKWFELLFGIWERWDGLWYIHIAQDGYGSQSPSAAFLPVYPLLIRSLHRLTFLPWIVCALIISNLCFLGAIYFLLKIYQLEGFDSERSERAVWYQVLFPGAIFFMAPYTESIYLFLLSGAFLAFRQKRWWLGCFLCGILSATRNLGVLVGVPVLVEMVMYLRVQSKHRNIFSTLAPLILVPSGILAVFCFWYFQNGDPLSLLHRQENWQRVVSMPWTTVWIGLKQSILYANSYPGGVYVLEALLTLLILLVVFFGFKKIRASYLILIFIQMLPPLIAPFPGRMLLSAPRYFSVIFPVFIILAELVPIGRWDQVIRLAFASLYGLSAALFVTSQWVY